MKNIINIDGIKYMRVDCTEAKKPPNKWEPSNRERGVGLDRLLAYQLKFCPNYDPDWDDDYAKYWQNLLPRTHNRGAMRKIK